MPDQPALPALLADRTAYKARLEQILPASITGTTASANEIAAAVAFTMMYVGAVDGHRPIRPSTVAWMRDGIAARRDDADRQAYYLAALRSKQAVDAQCHAWGLTETRSWYADNSREPIRDETLRTWADNGALVSGSGVQTTSSAPRYTLHPDFAALFDPTLTGEKLDTAIKDWQSRHLTLTGRARAARAHAAARAEEAVVVHLPDGGTRELHIGASSEIIRGVIEQFAPVRLGDPVVIFVSQSGEKVNVLDEALLKRLGLPVDQQRLLPDLLLADLDPARDALWLVEVVATDGPITEERRAALLGWATDHGVSPDRCRFLTAFESRTAAPFKKAVPQLARGSYAWFLDEPDGLLAWEDLAAE
ncbi:BsuBI/PstI family type II restriction endonuclease [Oryzihumus leptocrescens]|uniref:BsuBI/PstI restriction endonuclease n=1 Tax=Oryzihumus leptocrescens TaxID=297536 RepID=A0A542ZEI9_9MICO|nr:BsuBI/PstI family type II restriction endonuclease [Oryzihumus leptocrescens]TQL58754.1 BsuBI/PstI restriction endonuclease [Oryzihumus leptocrescens]